MTLDEMHTLVTLTEERHFGKAAATLGISQPALTKRVRHLEFRLGGPLFARHARGAEPTPAGLALYQRARRLLEEAAGLEHIARGILTGDLGTLRIGVGLTVMLSGLPRIFEQFRAQYPGVRLTVHDLSTAEQIRALTAGDLDVGFLRLGQQTPDLTLAPLLRDELRIACAESLAPSGRPYNSLFQHPLVITSRAASPTYHEHVLTTCKAIGYTPPGIQEANQLLTVLLLVQAGLGIGLVPASSHTLAVPRVRLLPTKLPGAAWQIGLAWNTNAPPSRAAERFREMAQRHFSK
ncbi:MAG: LysR family transcriptional regulator [Bryobacterales bacterium]|nr:LysR family transcriptional regulator [Bryobacterales bacterium]